MVVRGAWRVVRGAWCVVCGVRCVLAHCMGLGKTFQAIALIHALLKARPKQEVGWGGVNDE